MIVLQTICLAETSNQIQMDQQDHMLSNIKEQTAATLLKHRIIETQMLKEIISYQLGRIMAELKMVGDQAKAILDQSQVISNSLKFQQTGV